MASESIAIDSERGIIVKWHAFCNYHFLSFISQLDVDKQLVSTTVDIPQRQEIPALLSANSVWVLLRLKRKRKGILFKCLVQSANWGHCKLKLTVNANQVKCWFLRRGKTGVPGENLSAQRREPTNSTHMWHRVWESNPGHIGVRRASALTTAPSLMKTERLWDRAHRLSPLPEKNGAPDHLQMAKAALSLYLF